MIETWADGPTSLYHTHTHTHERNKMIKIQDATVETLDDTQARPVGSTILTVSFGGHTFQMVADADEVERALTIHNGGTKPCMTPAPATDKDDESYRATRSLLGS